MTYFISAWVKDTKTTPWNHLVKIKDDFYINGGKVEPFDIQARIDNALYVDEAVYNDPGPEEINNDLPAQSPNMAQETS